ncbi:hypothetical protein ACHAXH_002000 [Discostella pseudostelligera]
MEGATLPTCISSKRKDTIDGECLLVGSTKVIIQQVAHTDTTELERMSKFCIDTFYNHDENGEEVSLISRKWRYIQLAVLQKAQLLELSLSSDQYFRCIFVAKAIAADESDVIIGCCEVIEERIDTSQRPSTISERERRKTARHRPVIENLCVMEGYRKCGVGIALIQACENAVVQLSRGGGGYEEVFTQVDIDNTKAINLFRKCGYQDHFADPTCTKVVLDSLFANETTVTKLMMRKMLDY